jgi:hypothetical protein
MVAIKVEACKWKISQGKESIYVYKNNDFAGIVGSHKNDEFVFKGYKNQNNIKRAKTVVKLLSKAISHLETILQK